MQANSTSKIRTRLCSLLLAPFVVLALPSQNASASDLLGLYVGGSVGQSEVAENVPNPIVANPEIVHVPVPESATFKEDYTAFKVMVGLRPLPLLGAELSYMDFGHPAGSLFAKPADASMRGESAFGVVYLPIPMVDVFVKAGAAHIQSTVTGFAPNGIPDNICVVGVPCGTSPIRQDRNSTNFASGGGVQFKFDAWAVRAEYERFNFAGQSPYLASLGLTWSF
jgi:opacity protein-like surface antigen